MKAVLFAILLSGVVGAGSVLYSSRYESVLSDAIMHEGRTFEMPAAQLQKRLLAAPLPDSASLEFLPSGVVAIAPGRVDKAGNISWLMTVDDAGIARITAQITPVTPKLSRVATSYAVLDYARKKYGIYAPLFETELAKGTFRAASRTFAVKAIEGDAATGQEIRGAAAAFVTANPDLLQAHTRMASIAPFQEAERLYID